MKVTFTWVILSVLAVCSSALPRPKRQAYDLPDGAGLLLDSVDTSFQCQQDGYFADVNNNCQVFHVCHSIHQDRNPEMKQYTFICGNQTVFNQLSFTCAHPDDALPCGLSPDFYYLNGNVGVEDVPFLSEQDYQKGQDAINSVRFGEHPPSGRRTPSSSRSAPARRQGK